MSEGITIEPLSDPNDTDYRAVLRINRLTLENGGRTVLDLAVRIAAQNLAARIVEQLGPDIIARLDPQAIANMTLAEAGAAVNRTLKEKLPDKIIEVERDGEPVILQRGFFGGLRRI